VSPEDKERIGPILGRIPSGVFILIAGNGQGRQTGMLASWVQQASFDPPQVTVAVNASRYLIDWLQPGRSVTLNQVAKGDTSLFKHFGKGFDPDAEAFSGISLMEGRCGLPLLTSSLASLEGVVESFLPAADHHIFLITLTAGVCHLDPATHEPFVHLRRNGFHY
jgi:flavin reductase (DIM6/NTAB) family NADH-FMN oxidoreductase RutF